MTFFQDAPFRSFLLCVYLLVILTFTVQILFLDLDFRNIIIMDITGQIKYELLEVKCFVHVYFLPFILLVLRLSL